MRIGVIGTGHVGPSGTSTARLLPTGWRTCWPIRSSLNARNIWDVEELTQHGLSVARVGRLTPM